MAITHTKGPWIYQYGAVYGTDENGDSVRLLLADRGDVSTSPTERDRNVQLAAAAPEMVEALNTLINHVLHYASMPQAHPNAQRDAANARAIVAKATGSAA